MVLVEQRSSVLCVWCLYDPLQLWHELICQQLVLKQHGFCCWISQEIIQELEQKFMYPELQLRKGTQAVLLSGLDLWCGLSWMALISIWLEQEAAIGKSVRGGSKQSDHLLPSTVGWRMGRTWQAVLCACSMLSGFPDGVEWAGCQLLISFTNGLLGWQGTVLHAA